VTEAEVVYVAVDANRRKTRINREAGQGGAERAEAT
jgi:hypothetical protein